METELQQIEREIAIQHNIAKARIHFYTFCQLFDEQISPFYTDDKPYLKRLCNTLQLFYENKLLKDDGTPYDSLIINMPPRFGKSRTLTLFNAWILGQNKRERIMSCSYNDSMASEFSRFVRDLIAEERKEPTQVIYADIFPDSRIQKGNATLEKFALTGEPFSFLSAGVGGSVTGRGATWLQIDDPHKNCEEINSETYLQKVWNWFTGTLLSRREPGCKRIINMTRWCPGDLAGKILDSNDAHNWYHLVMPVQDEQGNMLCDKIMDAQAMERQRLIMDSLIFESNYLQNAMSPEGLMYPTLLTYDTLPKDALETISYTDSADGGSDFCTTIAGKPYKGELYVTDIYYSKKPMETTEPETAEFMFRNKVNRATMESNNGGRGFSRNVERLLWQNHKSRLTVFTWKHESTNKQARIITASSFVCKHVYFPANWAQRWPEFHRHITTYQRDKKAKNDDFEDCLTGISNLAGANKKTKHSLKLDTDGARPNYFKSVNNDYVFRGTDKQITEVRYGRDISYYREIFDSIKGKYTQES